MRHARVTRAAKGWLAGPWDSDLPLSVGFANEGFDEPHVHSSITEIYLVARGSASLRVEGETIELRAGDAAFVEPGEAHTFARSSIVIAGGRDIVLESEFGTTMSAPETQLTKPPRRSMRPTARPWRRPGRRA